MTKKKDKHKDAYGGESGEHAEQAGHKAKVMRVISDKAYRPMKPKALAGLMNVPRNKRAEFNDIASSLLRDGDIVIGGNGNISLPQHQGIHKGLFSGTRHGYGFVTPEDEGTVSRYGDIFIPAGATRDALNKDIVMCRIISADSGSRRAEGEIIRVVKKGYDAIVGTYSDGVFYPLDPKIGGDIVVRPENSLGASDGDKVMVTVLPRHTSSGLREGVVAEILGRGDEPGIDVLSIIRLHGIPHEWGSGVLDSAESLPGKVSDSDAEGRTDLRHIQTITIDGEDTKDVDDAVTINRLPNGNFRLGVHIADVAHYVRHGGPIDAEARTRGTSVYLADRVIPMLPPKLSNGICSLNAGCDRLALSCVMELDPAGALVSHEIFESVIHVDRAITYTVVNDIVTNGQNSPHYADNIRFTQMLEIMSELAAILRRKRLRRGSVEFGFHEAKITVDEHGRPTSIKASGRNTATSIIEEFMIAANETVAEEYFWRELPFIYRTHEEPSAESILKLNTFLKSFGHTIKGSKTHPGAISELLAKIESSPEEALVSRMVLRSFRQARYTPENIGHFGLASKYYTHFTSPIRRYPDLTIHRVIKAALHDRNKQIERIGDGLKKLCANCSLYERRAEACERDVANLKKAQFMMDRIGEVFPGIISGVTRHGIYVELENTVEGIISTAWLPEGYDFFPDRMCYTSRDGQSYSLGDKVAVEVKSVDTEAIARVNFAFAVE